MSSVTVFLPLSTFIHDGTLMGPCGAAATAVDPAVAAGGAIAADVSAALFALFPPPHATRPIAVPMRALCAILMTKLRSLSTLMLRAMRYNARSVLRGAKTGCVWTGSVSLVPGSSESVGSRGARRPTLRRRSSRLTVDARLAGSRLRGEPGRAPATLFGNCKIRDDG